MRPPRSSRPARLLSLALALLTLVALAPAAAAQGEVRFDKAVHLDSWEEAYYSEWSELYDFAPFDAADGRRLSRADLTELQRRWATEVARVRTEVEALEGDPLRLGRFRLDKALSGHPFLSKVGYVVDDSHPPHLFVVQKPPKEDPTYVGRISKGYAELFARLEADFVREIAAPLGLSRRPGAETSVVVVLATFGDLQNYASTTQPPAHYRDGGLWDNRLAGTVLHETPFVQRRAAHGRTYAALHGYAHVLLHAYSTSRKTHNWQTFAVEGLADWLANSQPYKRPPTEGAAGTPPPGAFKNFIAVATDPAKRWYAAHPLHEAVQSASYDFYLSALAARAKREGRPEPDVAEAYWAYLRQASLYTHYLMGQEGGALRAPWLEYVKAELTGSRGASVLAASLSGERAKEVDRRFLWWVIEEHRRLFPKIALHQPTVLGLAPAEGDATAKGAATATGAAGGSATPAEPALVTLALDALTPRARLALAIWDVREGRAEDALAALTALAAEVEVERFRERVDRERARVEQWIALRDAWLAAQAAGGGSLSWTEGDKRVKGKLLAVADGELRVDVRKRGEVTLALSALAAPGLARQMKGAGDLAEPWVRYYPYVLAGDSKWKRLLKGDDAGTAALRADAADDYPERLREAGALGRLQALADRDEPRSPAEGREVLAAIDELRATAWDLEFVVARKPALRALAVAAYGMLFEEVGLDDVVRGKIEPLPGGRMRVSYDFSDPAQLDDFPERKDILFLRTMYKPLSVDGVGFRIVGGELTGRGKASRRWVLGMTAPMTVRYEMSLDPPSDETLDKSLWYVGVGFCDDGNEDFLMGVNYFNLRGYGGRENELGEIETNRTYPYGAYVAITIEHDGERVVMRRGDGTETSIKALGNTTGGGFLWLHTDSQIRLDNLVFEGVVDDAALSVVRNAWVTEQLGEF
jgi:hypothetical protein